jgi:hypothetical protein
VFFCVMILYRCVRQGRFSETSVTTYKNAQRHSYKRISLFMTYNVFQYFERFMWTRVQIPWRSDVVRGRIQVLTADSMKMTAFWDLASCSLVKLDRRFINAYHLHHQGENGDTHLWKVFYLHDTTRRYITESCHLDTIPVWCFKTSLHPAA